MIFREFIENTRDTEFNECVRKITPRFEECLIRAFKNETLTFYKEAEKDVVQRFDDVVYPVGENLIELRRLQLPWFPDFRINQLRAHLETLCLDLSLNLGSLTIEGDYETNNPSLQAFLPVTNAGKITITFNNMTAKGKVGLFINEDSLLPENYDLVYETSEVDIRVKYNINGQTLETETTKLNVEETLGISIWNQLTQTLTELLSRQLRKVVSEFSLWELFGDNETHLRERERALTSRSDLIADNLLCAAKDFIVQRSGRQIIIPHFEMVFKGKPCSVHLGTIRTCQGYVKDFSTLTRRKSWSCYDDGREIVVFGYLTLDEYTHGYKFYQARFETTDVNGSIGMTVYENRVFIRIVHVKNDEHCDYYIDRLRFENIRDIDVDVSGLASLGWLISRIRSWTIGYFRHNTIRIQEDYIREAFNHAIQNCKCEHKSSEIIQNETHNKIT